MEDWIKDAQSKHLISFERPGFQGIIDKLSDNGFCNKIVNTKLCWLNAFELESIISNGRN